MNFGRPHRHYRATDSTNARAKALAESGAPGGLVVTAGEQSTGRGRQGRSWFAPAGTALLYSALLRPLGRRPLLPLAVPLAVCEACEEVAPVRCELKWPNDVWVEGRKLAGVLIESRPPAPGPREGAPSGATRLLSEEAGDDEDWAVIGVGLNVAVPADAFPPDLRETATSLGSGPPPSVSDAREALNAALGRWAGAPSGEVLARFRARDALRGRAIAWDDGEGTAAGIDDAGHLLVETGEGTRALGAGEVHLRVGSPG
ncbi:MAG: biotin--[acetyl-CoA-carboxylase] ligase [Solirubrobacterales bacterium]